MAAPQVAESITSTDTSEVPLLTSLLPYRHEEYRNFMIDHLITITLKHWDPAMRRSGATSLGLICELDLATLGPSVTGRVVSGFPNLPTDQRLTIAS